MNKIVLFSFLIIFNVAAFAQNVENKNDTTQQKSARKEKFFNAISRLSVGGYGEIVYKRNFFSDNINRYSHAQDYKNAPSHGRFDLPHITFMIGYEFGKGWRFSSEIEFEHGGTEAAVELEAEEAGEYETEVERGGEVAFEQFWIEKTFFPALNLRIGHIIVPVGFTNMRHIPTEFFTVERPEGENTILPCTWHETGLSLWGKAKNWRYEFAFLPGLNSELFNRQNWIGYSSKSPFEFKVANTFAGAFRIDNQSVKGLRIGASGYYGHSFNNSVQTTSSLKYKNVKGAVAIGSVDFEYNDHNFIARGYFDYGYLGDSQAISIYNKNLPKSSISSRTNVASDVLISGVEAGYNFFALSNNAKIAKQKFYLFGRYEYFNSMWKTAGNIPKDEWCSRQKIIGGFNYFPVKQVVIKAEYSYSVLKSPYNNEPTLSIGIAYAGFFTK
ncbi:MAG: hypothetical protein LBS50_02130 [Prevotellaceae bacterium]|jgi:hypothetical protein|nr:hypothetical protein [Prevotellaceae bacterium]